MTLSWAIVERILDELIASFQVLGTSLERDHPRNLADKLKYLQIMQRDTRLSQDVRDWLRTTRIEAKRLGNERHRIVHGIISRDKRVGDEWHVQRVVYEGPRARVTLSPLTDENLNKAVADISALLADIAPKVWLLTQGDTQAYSTEIIAKAKRELGIQ